MYCAPNVSATASSVQIQVVRQALQCAIITDNETMFVTDTSSVNQYVLSMIGLIHHADQLPIVGIPSR